MEQFLYSILASLIAGALVILIAPVFSSQLRWIFIEIFSRVLKIDVINVYKNKTTVRDDLVKDMEKSKKIKIFSGRGNELQRETFENILKSKGRENFKLLLPEYITDNVDNDWVAIRESELREIDSGYTKNTLRNQVEGNTKFLLKHVQNGNIDVGFYVAPHVGRIIVLDHVCYFTPYKKDVHSMHCRVFKYRKGGDMYNNFERYFDHSWKKRNKYNVDRIIKATNNVYKK